MIAFMLMFVLHIRREPFQRCMLSAVATHRR